MAHLKAERSLASDSGCPLECWLVPANKIVDRRRQKTDSFPTVELNWSGGQQERNVWRAIRHVRDDRRRPMRSRYVRI